VMGEVMRSDNPGRTIGELLAACKAATAASDLISGIPRDLVGR